MAAMPKRVPSIAPATRPRNNNILPLRARLVRRRRDVRMLIDRLGERLAFQRAVLRMYDTLIDKVGRQGSWPGGPRHEELQAIRQEEREHYLLLRETLEQLGADPTVQTPGTRRAQRLARGIPDMLSDTSVDARQCLEAVLIAELIDNDGWDSLSDLAMSIGQDKLAMLFEQAIERERHHLMAARAWLGAELSHEATVASRVSFGPRSTEVEPTSIAPILVPAATLLQ
jgi:rubrerythrin